MKILKSTEGIALFVAILVMTVVMLFLGASLFLSRVDTKITSNFKLGTQALEVADAGLQHALSLIQIGYDFDNDLNCGTPPCNILAPTTFPSGSDFTYTVSVENDSVDIGNGGSPTDDTDNLVVLVSTANGPSDSKRQVQAYVKRSATNFTPPSAVYINAYSTIPASDGNYFDDDSLQLIIGNDTNPGNLLNPNDDTVGPSPSLLGIGTTNSGIMDDIISKAEEPSIVSHNDILGEGGEPSVGVAGTVLDVNKIADKFIANATATYLNGYVSDSTSCPSSSPCYFGTSAAPQITYIKDTLSSDTTILGGYIRGYGVLVLEGRTMIGDVDASGDNFRFNGLVLHKRTDSSHYFVIDDSAWIYGAVMFGTNDGIVKFRIEDYGRLYYSSEALDGAPSFPSRRGLLPGWTSNPNGNQRKNRWMFSSTLAS
jgi:Tfp pilus assembly protein PilX